MRNSFCLDSGCVGQWPCQSDRLRKARFHGRLQCAIKPDVVCTHAASLGVTFAETVLPAFARPVCTGRLRTSLPLRGVDRLSHLLGLRGAEPRIDTLPPRS
mmetsp:Transcript_17397/g.43457  ORF Transcript_17397/g.43457 Transcript_17397/m.43457 type:complete len:101 (+) Transcript_17397:46-348(+)